MRAGLFMALALLVASARADDPALSAQALHASCRVHVDDPDAPGAQACAVYVQGVLDGIAASGMYAAAEPEPDRSAWSRRAARTRLGPRLPSLTAERNAVCPGAPPERADVIERLVRRYDEQPIAGEADAARLIEAMLREILSC